MAIIHVAEAPNSPFASRTLEGKRYTRIFNVESNTKLDGPYIVRNAAGIPNYGDTYAFGNESDSSAVALQIDSVRKADNAMHWTVTVIYTQPPDKQNPNVDKFTLVERSWDAVLVTRYVDTDLSGKPLRNSAGDRFDPLPPLEYPRPILRVTKNVPSFSPATILAYSGALNSDQFYGWPPGYARMMPIRKNEQAEVLGDIMVQYDTVQYEVHFDPYGWISHDDLLDVGFREKISYGAFGPGFFSVHIRDPEGAYVTTPQLLDGNGRAFSDPSTATPVYLPFDMFRFQPFAPLGL